MKKQKNLRNISLEFDRSILTLKEEVRILNNLNSNLSKDKEKMSNEINKYEKSKEMLISKINFIEKESNQFMNNVKFLTEKTIKKKKNKFFI